MENNHAKNDRGRRAARRLYDAGMAGADLLLRAARPLGTKFRERSGLLKESPEQNRLWVHACSAGEMTVARRFIDCWRKATGRSGVFLTAWTGDGYTMALRNRRDGEQVAWFPIDSLAAMRRAYESVRPAAVVLCEAELWPNHLAEAKARGIPVFVINGRMSAEDRRKYNHLGPIAADFFSIPEIICAQSEDDGRRFASLGARQMTVTGNMKFDPLPENDDNRTDTRKFGVSPYILAASTHPGEERHVLQAYIKCARARPDLKLVIAPRHVRRSKGIKALARHEGFRASMWSQCDESTDAQCVVVDCLGVLAELYRRAEFAFVGKSLRAGGGQNFLEAVQAGCPVLTGPCTTNFDSMLAPFLAADAVWQLKDPAELAEAFESLASNKEKRLFMAREAQRILEENSGATESTVREILSRL